MLHLHDRAGLLAVPHDPTLDDELRALLAARVAHLQAQGLLDMTEIVVVDSSTTEAELIDAIGYTPLRDIDGRRFGQPGFVANLDYVARVSPRYHEIIVTVGNSGFAFQLLVRDDADPDLVALCRECAA